MSSDHAPDTAADNRRTVLVVDDTPANIEMMNGVLAPHYRVRVATDGEKALRIIRSGSPPDLVLLDVVMPGMDGYAVCEAIHADPATRSIPVVFVTSADEPTDEQRGFAAGGIDYITRPFVPALMLVRLDVQMQLLDARESLERRYNELRALEAARDSLIHMIVHDLRSPLGSAYSLLEVALDQPDLPPLLLKVLTGARASVAQVSERAKAILDVARLEAGHMKPHLAESDLRNVAEAAITALEGLARFHRIALSADSLHPVQVDPVLLERVLVNLLSNALRHAPRETTIRLGITQEDGTTRLTVANEGQGIPEAYR
ncbi:MAG: response regulator, partial [Planctomycetota bacterium]